MGTTYIRIEFSNFYGKRKGYYRVHGLLYSNQYNPFHVSQSVFVRSIFMPPPQVMVSLQFCNQNSQRIAHSPEQPLTCYLRITYLIRPIWYVTHCCLYLTKYGKLLETQYFRKEKHSICTGSGRMFRVHRPTSIPVKLHSVT